MAEQQSVDALEELLGPYARLAEEYLRRWLIEPGTPPALGEAMRYCVFSGGKRLRPALVLMAAEALGTKDYEELTGRAAAAVELVHCYSLVHDDLPAMDDDALRRGRPTAHVRFGEAMAILAGDALLSRAFGVLAECRSPTGGQLAAELARGAGPAGMIAGQVADMGLCKLPEGLEGMRFIHSRKTAALIRAAARMGAICSRAGQKQLAAITAYAESLGLAFQLIDDMLDVTSDAKRLGKTPGKDAASGKRTHVAVLGLESAAELGRELTQHAVDALGPLGQKARKLEELARLLAERMH